MANIERRANFYFINGRPSAGKDFQGERLQSLLPESVIFSSGDIFRGAINPDGKYGKFHPMLKEHIPSMFAGKVLKDEVVIPIISAVRQDYLKQGYLNIIETGTVRSLAQLDAIDLELANLRESGMDVKDTHLCFAVTEQIAEKRVNYRRQLAAEGKAPERSDDKPEKFSTRLNDYRNITEEMLKRLVLENRLLIIKANGGPDEVTNVMIEKLILNNRFDLNHIQTNPDIAEKFFLDQFVNA